MRGLVVAAAALVGGCATITEGTTQALVVDVVPESGVCEVTREGAFMGRSTPGSRTVSVSKSYYDLTFVCSAPGYLPKTEPLKSALSAMTVGSFFLLDLGIVDAATGAWMKYPSRVTIVLQRDIATR